MSSAIELHLSSVTTAGLVHSEAASNDRPAMADRRRPGDGSERPVSDGQLPDDDPLSLVLPVANGVA